MNPLPCELKTNEQEYTMPTILASNMQPVDARSINEFSKSDGQSGLKGLSERALAKDKLAGVDEGQLETRSSVFAEGKHKDPVLPRNPVQPALPSTKPHAAQDFPEPGSSDSEQVAKDLDSSRNRNKIQKLIDEHNILQSRSQLQSFVDSYETLENAETEMLITMIKGEAERYAAVRQLADQLHGLETKAMNSALQAGK